MKRKYAVEPWDVNQGKFKVTKEEVVYSDEWYALAVSRYGENEHYSLGMRWQFDNQEKPYGFPNMFGRPVWMIIPDDLAVPILAHILNTIKDKENGVDYKKLINAIKNLKGIKE